MPAFTLSTGHGKGETSVVLLSRNHASAVFLVLDGWVAARPELVQDAKTHAWFAGRGVLPRIDEAAQEIDSAG